MPLSVKEIQAIEAKLPKTAIVLAPNSSMNIERIRDIDKLNITPTEALEYALIKNNTWTIAEAIREHGLNKLLELEAELDDFEAEDALEYAIDNIPTNVLTTLLNAHGYQPIPKRKQALRDNALINSH